MRTKFYRSLSQARSVLNQCAQPTLSDAEREAIERESEKAVEAERRRQQKLALVSHPVIDPVHGWRFRVMRRYQTRDGDHFECIGETRTLAAAEDIARKEAGAALVFEIGKQRFFNWRTTEVRA